MRKVLSLLLLPLAAIAGLSSAYAQAPVGGTYVQSLDELSNQKAYTIDCARGAFLTKNGYLASTAHSSLKDADPAKFAILSYENNYYLYSVADDKFVKNNGELSDRLTNGTEEALKMDPKTNPYFLFYFTINGANYGLNTNGDDPYGYVINSWMTADAGNQYRIAEAGDFDPTNALAELEYYFHQAPTVTYVVKDNKDNIIFTSNPITVELGTTITSLPEKYQRPYYSYNTVNVTISEKETVIGFTATWEGPFEISDDFASAHWYALAMRGTWYVTSAKTANDGAYQTQNANVLGLVEESYHWAFMGNGYDGFQILNKAAGEGMSFGYTNDNKRDSGIPTLLDDNEGNHAWNIAPSRSTIANSFTLNISGTNLYINQYGGAGGSMKFWNSANNVTDAGSAFSVMEVPTDFAEYVNSEIAPYFDAAYFGLNDEARAAVGYDDSYKTTCSFDEYKRLTEAIAEVITDKSNFVYPETGYYRIKSAQYPGRYMSYAEINGAPMIATVVNPEESAANIIKLTALGDYKYLVSVGGRYATSPSASVKVALETESVEFTAVVNGPGKGTFTTGAQYGALHCAASSSPAYYVVGWTDAADASQWIIEDVEAASVDVTIGETGYATLNALWPVTIPEGVKAYTGKIDSKDGALELFLTEVNGTIPSATPVVLKGNADTYTFNFTDDVETLDNDLKGTYAETDAAGKYILAKPERKYIGFYLAETGTIVAGKAYLELPANAGEVKGITLVGDNATGIASVENTTTENNAVFNLAGQRVSEAQKGIFIINGKKVLK